MPKGTELACPRQGKPVSARTCHIGAFCGYWTQGGGGPDMPGGCAAGGFAAPRVRAAIAAARLAKREALAARRTARMEKHNEDPMPAAHLPRAGLGARAAGIAAAPVHGRGTPFEGSDTNSLNSGTGGGTAAADAILARLPNRAARRRWKSLQRRKSRAARAIGGTKVRPGAPPSGDSPRWPDGAGWRRSPHPRRFAPRPLPLAGEVKRGAGTLGRKFRRPAGRAGRPGPVTAETAGLRASIPGTWLAQRGSNTDPDLP